MKKLSCDECGEEIEEGKFFYTVEKRARMGQKTVSESIYEMRLCHFCHALRGLEMADRVMPRKELLDCLTEKYQDERRGVSKE